MKKIIGVLLLAGLLIVVGLTVDRRGGEDRDREAATRLYKKGMEHLFSFQYRKAEAALDSALTLAPDFAMAATALADLYARLGRKEDYEAILARADSLAAGVKDRRERVLTELWLSNHLESRFTDLQDSLLALAQAADSNHLIVLHTQANRADRSGDPERTERLWKHILDVHPNYANAYNMLGYLALNRGRYDEAISQLRTYAFLAPDLANPHDSLGEILMTIGRYEEAEEEFKAALAKQPDFYYSLINLGRVYIARGQLDKGVDVLERVRKGLEGTEIEQQVDQVLIETYYTNGLLADLDRATARFVERYPTSHPTSYFRAMRLVMGGRTAMARAVMDSAVSAWREEPGYDRYPRFRNSVEAAQDRFEALLAEVQEDPTRAVLHWSKVLQRLADSPPHTLVYERERCARALVELGGFAAALDQLDTNLAINPRLMRSLVLAVQSNLGLGRQPEAERLLAALGEALRFADPDYPVREDYARLRTQVN